MKKKKRNINNNLAVWLCHDNPLIPEPMFAKDDFDILLEHHYWNYIIELILGSKPKSMKIYPFFSIEQKELDTFL